MHSKYETSGLCNNVVEAACVLDSNQSSPTYKFQKLPEPQFPHLLKTGMMTPAPHDC